MTTLFWPKTKLGLDVFGHRMAWTVARHGPARIILGTDHPWHGMARIIHGTERSQKARHVQFVARPNYPMARHGTSLVNVHQLLSSGNNPGRHEAVCAI